MLDARRCSGFPGGRTGERSGRVSHGLVRERRRVQVRGNGRRLVADVPKMTVNLSLTARCRSRQENLVPLRKDRAVTFSDMAQVLQARILADLKAGEVTDAPRNRPDEPRGVGALEAHIATLEKALVKAEAMGEQRRREAESAARRVEALELKIATLADSLTKAQAASEQRCQEVERSARRVEALEANIAALEETVTKAEAMGEQRRQEAQVATKRANDLVAEVVEMTSELAEMSRRMAEQTAAMDKMRAEIEEFRSRSW